MQHKFATKWLDGTGTVDRTDGGQYDKSHAVYLKYSVKSATSKYHDMATILLITLASEYDTAQSEMELF